MGPVHHPRSPHRQTLNPHVRVRQANQSPIPRTQLPSRKRRRQTQQLVMAQARRKTRPQHKQQSRLAHRLRLVQPLGHTPQSPQRHQVQLIKQQSRFAQAQSVPPWCRCKVEQRLAQRHVRSRLHAQTIKSARPQALPVSGHSRNSSGNRNKPCSAASSWSAPHHAAPPPTCANAGTHP